MTSVRDFFPLHAPQKYKQKNYIKENIQKIRNRSKCKSTTRLGACHEKSGATISKTSSTDDVRQLSRLGYTACKDKPATIKCNVKIKGQRNSALCKQLEKFTLQDAENTDVQDTDKSGKCYRDQACQTEEINNKCVIDVPVYQDECTFCGHIVDKKNTTLQTTYADCSTECDNINVPSYLTDNKTGSNENVENSTKYTYKRHSCTNQEISTKSTHKIGVVPRYLKERNTQIEQEQNAAKEREKFEEKLGMKDPACPPGHMLMPTEERKQRLDQVQKEFNELIRQLNMMPVSSDSFRIRQRKIEIEKDLNKLENVINLLNKEKVFIPLTDSCTA